MNFSRLISDLWLAPRLRKSGQKILIKTAWRGAPTSRFTIKPKGQREQQQADLMALLLRAHQEAERGTLSRQQLLDLRKRIDRAIQNA